MDCLEYLVKNVSSVGKGTISFLTMCSSEEGSRNDWLKYLFKNVFSIGKGKISFLTMCSSEESSRIDWLEYFVKKLIFYRKMNTHFPYNLFLGRRL